MKKALIAGAASTVLAAMPIVGVFATTGTVTDTVRLTVNKSCEMTATDGSIIDFSTGGTGARAEQNGTVMTITCNSNSGWTLKATATALTASTTEQTIPFGAYGTTASVWSAKVTLGGNNVANAAIQSGWNDYTVAAASEAVVVASETDTAVSGLTVTPSYKAYVAADQAQGAYEGTITYTFAENV